MILIVTNKQDSHSDEVIRILNELNINVFRLNTEDLVNKYKIKLSITPTGEWSGHIIDDVERVLKIEEIKVAWLRKPEFNFFNDNLPRTAHEEYISSEIKALINTLYSIPNIKWINDPFIANKTKNKFQQLILASKFNIKIPKTIITNLPSEALNFFIECGDKEILVKSIYTGNITVDGINQAIPSMKIGKDDFYKHYNRIVNSPTQLQEYIHKLYELRITIIGENVFAVKIDSQLHEETKIDWRLHTALNPHSVYNLPVFVKEFCIAFIKEQNLVFGAMDFIVTPLQEYVFLENNPFGQYLWLEFETKVPLTNAMVQLLIQLNK